MPCAAYCRPWFLFDRRVLFGQRVISKLAPARRQGNGNTAAKNPASVMRSSAVSKGPNSGTAIRSWETKEFHMTPVGIKNNDR